MRRYFVDASVFNGDEVRLSGDVFHHIVDVCRQHQGSKFEVITAGGKAYLVELIQVEKKKATAKILETRQIPALATPHIHLAVSIPKFPTFETILEKAVELGVKSVTPFYSEFSFIRKGTSLPVGKTERWQKIIQSATQQSGRGDLLELNAVCTMKELFNRINLNSDTKGLFAYEGESTLGIKNYLQNIKNPQNLWLFIGSEGGFSYSEVEEFKKLGLDPVTLGSQVLRVETACLTLVSILKYQFEAW